MQTSEQKITTAIARKQPTGAVCAVGRRSETDDEQPRARVAKAGDRSAVIVPVGVAFDLVGRDIDAVAT